MKIVRIWEGLGNQMFQYAFAKGLEKRYPGDVYLDINSSYRDHFRKMESNVLRPYMLDDFCISLPTINVEELKEWSFLRQSNWREKRTFKKSLSHKYDYQFISDSYDVTEYNPSFYYTKENVYYMGWYQNEKYFRDIIENIKQDFELKECLLSPDILKGKSTVSIHVRRGDFVNGGWCVSNEYYRKAIGYMSEKIDRPTFIIFTDDVAWAKENMKLKFENYFMADIGEYSASEELVLMSRCQHNIIANSTFSWWGAWLNKNKNKIVISPQKWTPRQKNPNCPDWIIL